MQEYHNYVESDNEASSAAGNSKQTAQSKKKAYRQLLTLVDKVLPWEVKHIDAVLQRVWPGPCTSKLIELCGEPTQPPVEKVKARLDFFGFQPPSNNSPGIARCNPNSLCMMLGFKETLAENIQHASMLQQAFRALNPTTEETPARVVCETAIKVVDDMVEKGENRLQEMIKYFEARAELEKRALALPAIADTFMAIYFHDENEATRWRSSLEGIKQDLESMIQFTKLYLKYLLPEAGSP